MKRIIIPLTFLSLTAFAGAPDCGSLGNIISDMESDLQKQSLKQCQNVQYKDAITPTTDGKPSSLLGDPTIAQHFIDSRCFSLGTVEAEIARMEGQLAIYRGLQEFSKDLSKKNDSLKTVVNSDVYAKQVVKDAKLLERGLKTAAVLEALVNLDVDFLKQLKERTSGGNLVQRDWDEVVSKTCPNAEKINLCTSLTQMAEYLGEDVYKEIGGVLKTSSLDSSSVKGLKTALSIKDSEGEDTSFDELIQELKIAGADFSKVNPKANLDQKLIKALKKIPSFSTNGDMDFIKSIKTAKQGLETKSVIDSFKYLSEDVSNRNNLTVKTKLSALIYSVDKAGKLGDDSKEACKALLDPVVPASTCLEAMKKSVGDLPAEFWQEKDSISRIETLQNSNKEITDFTNMCLNEDVLISNVGTDILKDCKQNFISEENILSKKLTAYNLMRQKLLSENKKSLDFRNYAIQKLDTQKCAQAKNSLSTLSDCGGISMESINPVINVLSGDIMKVAVMYNNDPDVDIDAYCDEDTKKNELEAKICLFTTEEKGQDNGTSLSLRSLAEIDAPIDVAEKRAEKDMKMNALSNALNGIASTLGQQNRNYNNPYNYLSPYSSATPPMTISDALTYNATMYGGYGGYYPLNNASPYVFNSQVLKYTGATTGNNLFSYSAAGPTTSYGPSSFLPSFKFD